MSQTDRSYRPDIDGLRALAVLAVVGFPRLSRAAARRLRRRRRLLRHLRLSDLRHHSRGAERRAASALRASTPAASGGFSRRSAVVLAAAIVAGWFLLYADDYARLGYHAAAGAALRRRTSRSGGSRLLRYRRRAEAAAAPVVARRRGTVLPGVAAAAGLRARDGDAARWRRRSRSGRRRSVRAIWTVRIDRTPAFYAPWNRFWELLAGATLACIEADAVLDAWRRRLLSRPWLPDVSAIAGLAAIGAGAC